MVACTDKSPSGQIKSMLTRIDKVENRVEKLYNQDFKELVDDYKDLDTTIARTRDIHREMILLQAYLQQFEYQVDIIYMNTEYSREQLSNLQYDIENQVYCDDTIAMFIRDEEKALREMEAQVKYFQEKFDAQKEVVKQLRKE